MREDKNKYSKRLRVALSVIPLIAMLTLASVSDAEAVGSGVLSSPGIVSDSTMKAGQKVTWDCVWFGSYPQREVVASAESCGTYGRDYYSTDDYILDSSLYSKLQSASWDSKDETTIDGNKYRRMTVSDALCESSAFSESYNWSNSSESYHYFKYEAIKWRVLSVDGSTALLLADEALDDVPFNSNRSYGNCWSESEIRSWLNGYSGSENAAGRNYSGDNFLDDAFTSTEQGAILDETVSGDSLYTKDSGDVSVTDKIFYLADGDVYGTDTAVSYGFAADSAVYDEARRCKSSTYAKALGISSDSGYGQGYDGNCSWWLRSPGYPSSYVMYIFRDGDGVEAGDVDCYGTFVYDDGLGVRPALKLDLSSSLYSYAGTVCSYEAMSQPEEDAVTDTSHTHTWSAYKTSTAASIKKAGVQTRICTECGEKQTRSIAKLTPSIKLSKTKLTLKKKRSRTITVTFRKGDSIKKVRSSKKSVASVKKISSTKVKITTRKKGKTTITIKLSSGKKATCKVTVK